MNNPNHELVLDLWQRIKAIIQPKERLEVADTLIVVFDEFNFLDDDFVNEDLDKELRAAAKSHLVTHDDIDDLDEDDDGYY